MKKIRSHCAGIDIGAKRVFTNVEGEQVVSHLTFTEDFYKLRDYLLQHKVETVAMEATGVYWIILYEILEEAGIDVWLVDGRQTKQVPGRKTDVKDCQWICELHSFGLLNRCLVVDSDIKELRTYVRIREGHIESGSKHINQMQKALVMMNIRLKEVLSQIHGVSGMAIIEAILNGERNRDKLVSLCHIKVLNNKKDLVYKALEGKYTEAGLFALKQAYDGYYFYQNQISECDKKISDVLNRLGNSGVGQDKKKRKAIRHNKPNVDKLDGNLLNLFDNNDATKISGISDYTWMQLLSEIGTDLSRWPSEKHFTSWLGLSPGQKNSGKKNRNARKKGKPRAGQIFKIIAQGLINSKNIAIGAFGRRLRGRKGPAIAIKAMARKLAEIYWRMMVKGVDYVEQGVKMYEKQIAANKLKTLKKLANEFNLEISG
ncbi:MAG TPA: IS110 family transposase [Marinilabiliaceae bacterium]|jgi:transposase|nr:IS110 family transposase [Synergistaceae bacterium]HKL71175.1 IS110 family transposase [Marinilabiliaceae bacterium]